MDSGGNGKIFNPINTDKLDSPQRQLRVPYEAIRTALTPFLGLCVADIGSGSGYFSFALLGSDTPPLRIDAVDISAQMNQIFQQRLQAHLLRERVIFHEGVGEALPLSDAMVDIVMMGQVFHEFSNPLKALQEAHRILRPGGRVFIVDWEVPEDQSVLPESGPPYDHRCAEDEVKSHLSAAGFHEVERHSGFIGVYALSAQKL